MHILLHHDILRVTKNAGRACIGHRIFYCAAADVQIHHSSWWQTIKLSSVDDHGLFRYMSMPCVAPCLPLKIAAGLLQQKKKQLKEAGPVCIVHAPLRTPPGVDKQHLNWSLLIMLKTPVLRLNHWRLTSGTHQLINRAAIGATHCVCESRCNRSSSTIVRGTMQADATHRCTGVRMKQMKHVVNIEMYGIALNKALLLHATGQPHRLCQGECHISQASGHQTITWSPSRLRTCIPKSMAADSNSHVVHAAYPA